MFTPRAYRAARERRASTRAIHDAAVTDVLQATRSLGENGKLPPESLYGARKMWHYLQRRGFTGLARCTVERLMSELGMEGLVRGKQIRTTRSTRNSRRAPGLLDRDFTVAYPNQKWVTDFVRHEALCVWEVM